MIKQTTLCYLERDGKYLMLHRTKKEKDANRDKWIGVGGHFEEGEDAILCMKREVFEETGYTVTEYRYCGVVAFRSSDFPPEDMHLFLIPGFSGEEKICDEGDLEWIERERVYQLAMWEGDRIFLKLLEEDRPFFRLLLTYDGEVLSGAVLDGETIK